MEKLGENIRRFRIERGITIKKLSKLTSLSQSFISKLERGELNPSIASVRKIADSLKIPLPDFFHTDDTDIIQEDDSDIVVRKDKRLQLLYPGLKVSEYLLTPNITGIGIEFLYSKVEPGGSSGKEPASHNGEECIIVITGELTLYYKDRVILLNEGDSMHLYSRIPHRWENNGKKTTEIIWVTVPPTL